MRIAIDVSQLVYHNTGVANYLEQLVLTLLKVDQTNHYILFASSLRRDLSFLERKFGKYTNVTIKTAKLPPVMLDILWNKLHIFSIENLIGSVDIFISSDWTEPPVRTAKKITILYDLIVYKHPKETAANIISVQKRKLAWVKKESVRVLCISEATKKDAEEILGLDTNKLAVLYPGVTL
ncbi:hypothetical protein BH11PAT1_BH11PAT1_0060 [soil metagenome]